MRSFHVPDTARHVRLSAQHAFRSDLARHARHFVGEHAEPVDHVVDRVRQLENLALGFDRDLLRQIAGGDRRGDQRDVPHLIGQVRRHEVHVVGEVLPRAAHAGHFGLAAEHSFRTHLARDARDFRGERRELVDHRVDRVLEGQHLALGFDRDLARQVALRHRRRDVGDVAHLAGEVAGHRVHGIGQILPRAADARHVGLAAQHAFCSHFARHARHFGCKGRQLVDHDVDRVLELEHLALRFDGDLLRQVAVGDGGRDDGDAAHLAREVRRHGVHAVREILPRTADARHVGLAAQHAFGAHFARDARHFRRERVELVDHPIHGRSNAEELALHLLALDLELDLLREIAFGDRLDHARHLGGGLHEIGDQTIDRIHGGHPLPAHAGHRHAVAHLAFASDRRAHPPDLFDQARALLRDVVECLDDLGHQADRRSTPVARRSRPR